MKIESLSSSRSAALRKTERGGANGANGDFARTLSTEAPRKPPEIGGSASISRVDTILALQEVPDPEARRKRAVRRGEELLEELEEVRLGILSGTIPRDRLKRLAQSLEQTRERVEDEQLAEVLAEIELRAAVELAKLEA